MKVLYCDCFSGVSGDMLLGALIDAGMPVDVLHTELSKLGLPEYIQTKANETHKKGMRASYLQFELAEGGDHDQDHHGHAHSRHLSDIKEIIQRSALSSRVKETSLRVFQRLAEAEAKVHGSSIDHVHFHEVGAVDSILDICGIMVGLEYFHIDEIYSSPIPVGGGTVQTSHGILPVPAPATLELMKMCSAPTVSSSAQVEQVTPTGMAILSEFAQFSRPEMRIQQVGIGAGTRELPWANILRIFMGECSEEESMHVEIETNLDDMTPQSLGYIMPKLLEAGALDVAFTHIQMKKNRPGIKLSVIARQSDENRLSKMLLRETSTFGVRIHAIYRVEADRSIREVNSSFGIVRVKDKILDGEIVWSYPEYDDCVRIADEREMPLDAVLQQLNRENLIK
jgi:hypothetical protein